MIPGVAFHLQRSMLLAENKKAQINMDWTNFDWFSDRMKKSLFTSISSNHLM